VGWVGVGSVREGVGRMGEGVQGLHSILGFRLDGLREGARAGSTQAASWQPGWRFRIVPKIFTDVSPTADTFVPFTEDPILSISAVSVMV
jgi:hypothetical protein